MRIPTLLCLLLAACTPAPSKDPTAVAAAPLAAVNKVQRGDTLASQAELDFQVGWMEVQHGALVRGGHVNVVYNQARMTDCAGPTVISYALFQPGGQLFSSDEAFSFDVPEDADSVGLWFHAVAPGCEQWDSNYGANWNFPVVTSPPAGVGWVGDWGSSTNRDCEHDSGVPQPIVIDEYMRERSCIFIDADIWVSGVTDVAAAHPEWIFAQVAWVKDSATPVETWLDYQGIIGHNARFRFTVPYDIRDMADWTTVSYFFRFSTDGNRWTQAAQPSGDDWTMTRAFTLPDAGAAGASSAYRTVK